MADNYAMSPEQVDALNRENRELLERSLHAAVMGKISEPDANGWMPIESAPKDVQILAYEPEYGWLLASWCHDRWLIKSSGNFWARLPGSVTLTRWQPLPKPPVSEASK